MSLKFERGTRGLFSKKAEKVCYILTEDIKTLELPL